MWTGKKCMGTLHEPSTVHKMFKSAQNSSDTHIIISSIEKCGTVGPILYHLTIKLMLFSLLCL